MTSLLTSDSELKSELVRLTLENAELTRKLEFCSKWMEREVRDQAHRIATKRVGKMTSIDRDDFLGQNQEEIITSRIRAYFGELLLLNAPKSTVEYLVDSEISYFSLSKMPNGDGVGVISSYTKILDSLIEGLITAQYRKFVLKKWPVYLRANDPLEKALHLVITKKYTLSTGRLFGLLKSIRQGGSLLEFSAEFREYLTKYIDLGNLLLSDAFYRPYGELVEGDVFGGKRHSGRITLEETTKIRELLVGGYTHKNGLLHQLLAQNSIGI
jgi:hypothetical protein